MKNHESLKVKVDQTFIKTNTFILHVGNLRYRILHDLIPQRSDANHYQNTPLLDTPSFNLIEIVTLYISLEAFTILYLIKPSCQRERGKERLKKYRGVGTQRGNIEHVRFQLKPQNQKIHQIYYVSFENLTRSRH